jgi:hypothetical protein
MNITIRSEITEDRESVWNVNQTAFDGDDEANLVDALRDGGFVVASIVAELNDEIAGHILFSHVSILTEHRSVDAVSLAPMAVSPANVRQRGIRTAAECRLITQTAIRRIFSAIPTFIHDSVSLPTWPGHRNRHSVVVERGWR